MSTILEAIDTTFLGSGTPMDSLSVEQLLKRLLDSKKITKKELIKKLMSMKPTEDDKTSDGLSSIMPEVGDEKLISMSNERQECEVSVDTNSIAGL